MKGKSEKEQLQEKWIHDIVQAYKAYKGSAEPPVTAKRIAAIEKNLGKMKAHELMLIMQYMGAEFPKYLL